MGRWTVSAASCYCLWIRRLPLIPSQFENGFATTLDFWSYEDIHTDFSRRDSGAISPEQLWRRLAIRQGQLKEALSADLSQYEELDKRIFHLQALEQDHASLSLRLSELSSEIARPSSGWWPALTISSQERRANKGRIRIGWREESESHPGLSSRLGEAKPRSPSASRFCLAS